VSCDNVLVTASAAVTARRVLLHLEEGRRVPVDPSEVLFLEADGDRTEVRTRG
jgi:DNA-binding LytR/AlgR family response regulator